MFTLAWKLEGLSLGLLIPVGKQLPDTPKQLRAAILDFSYWLIILCFNQ